MADEIHESIPQPRSDRQEPQVRVANQSIPSQRDAREKTGDQLPETNIPRTDAIVVTGHSNPLGTKDAGIVPPYNPDPLIAAATREREQQDKARLAGNQSAQDQAQQ